MKDFIRFSIVIPARNEEENITVLLNAIRQQHYPKEYFEVIVVDDHSTDDTAALVRKFEEVRYILLSDDKHNSYKKWAIEAGVAAAGNEFIVATDADCIPGKNWLKSIASCIANKNAVFVAAPVHLISAPSALGLFQEMDFMVLQAITGAVVSKNQLSMCNGANLAYSKAAFYEVNGFRDIDHIASGDDMLLMYKIWKHYPSRVAYLRSKQAIVETKAQSTWKEFFNQRIRWASKARNYQDKRIWPVLLLVYIFNLSCLVLFIAAIVDPCYWSWILALWLAKTFVELPLFFSAASFFNRKKLAGLFFLFQPFHILYTIISGLFGQFGKYEWKGRIVE